MIWGGNLWGRAPWGAQSQTASDVTFALTGIAASSSVGTFGLIVAPTLAGVAASSAVGSFSGGVASGLGGVAGTGSVGGYTPIVDVLLPGLAATSAVGAFTPVFNVDFALTGIPATSAVGSFSLIVAVNLPGVSASSSVGSFVNGVSVPLLGEGWPGYSVYQSWFVPPRSVGGVIYFEPPNPTGIDWATWASWLRDAITQMEVGQSLPMVPVEDQWHVWISEMVESSKILQHLNVPRPEYVPTWQAWGLYLQQLI